MDRKISLFTIFSILNPFMVSAQSIDPPATGLSNLNMDSRTVYNMGNLVGRPFLLNPYSNIKGTAYFIDSFSNCTIKIRGGQTYGGLKMRMNLVTNQLHFRQSDSMEMVAGKEAVERVTFLQEINNEIKATSFSNGYPFIDNNDGLTYYEEICSGKAVFLKLTYKVLTKEQGLTATPLDQKFVNNYAWYVFANKKIERWRKGEAFILFMLDDQKEKVREFISREKLKCKSPAEAEKIIDFYNGI
jgi:hypothetical protein